MKCDFCNIELFRELTWFYPTTDFSMIKTATDKGSLDLTSVEGWAACEVCSVLVEFKDEQALSLRYIKLNPLGSAKDPEFVESFRRILEETFLAFFSNRSASRFRPTRKDWDRFQIMAKQAQDQIDEAKKNLF